MNNPIIPGHLSGARLVAVVCAAQVLVQLGAFFWPALLPGMMPRWGLTNFIGEKEASHNFEYFIEARRLTQKARPEFGLILGVEYIIPSVSMGGVGSMAIAGSVAPNLMQKLYDLCAAGKFAEALPLQDKASHYWQIFKPEYPSPIKAATEMMGRPVGTVRGPMRPLTDAQKKTLRKELEILGAFDGSEPQGW